MEEKLICITTAKTRIEAEQMISFLKENGIYAVVQGEFRSFIPVILFPAKK